RESRLHSPALRVPVKTSLLINENDKYFALFQEKRKCCFPSKRKRKSGDVVCSRGLKTKVLNLPVLQPGSFASPLKLEKVVEWISCSLDSWSLSPLGTKKFPRTVEQPIDSTQPDGLITPSIDRRGTGTRSGLLPQRSTPC
uniref:Uncharacterized protein n=1 Tax=Aegilops tauschii subsp. strangulata TaxID=200361 RepID=A0A453FBS7_AEGTS